MSSKIIANLEDHNKTSTRIDLNQLSSQSNWNTGRSFKSYIDPSFMNDQKDAATQLEQIQFKAKQLKERQKRQRNYLKKLKKMYEQQLRQFQQFQRVTKKALQQKSREVELLTMQNTQFKEQRIQFCTLKDEKQILCLKNQQLNEQNKRISQQLQSLQQNYKNLKTQFEQQSQLLDKGIRQNQIESQAPAFAVPGSLLEVQQLTRDLQEQRRNQLDEKIKKDEEHLKAQSEQISNCNFMLQNLLKQIKKTQKQRQSEDGQIQNKIVKSQQKLMSLTDQLMKKTSQLSQAINNAHRFERELKQKQTQLKNLNEQLQQQQSICQQKLIEIQTYKQEIQIYQDSQKIRLQTQFQNKQKKAKNFERFQQKLLKTLQQKTIKQYYNVYDVLSNTANQIFKAFNNHNEEINNTGDKFIQSALKVVELNLIKLNQYFKQKSQKDIDKFHKMMGFITQANTIIDKKLQEQDYIQKDDKQIFMQSSPQRFHSIQPVTQNHHHRQQSQSSAKSFKKSIVLEQDMDNAINLNQQLQDQLKQQILQQQLSNMKNSQVILDSLNDGSEKSDTIKDAISQSSFAKSKISQMSASQQTRHYNQKKKSDLLKARLKKKKTMKN